jgi:hypothetical protein
MARVVTADLPGPLEHDERRATHTVTQAWGTKSGGLETGTYGVLSETQGRGCVCGDTVPCLGPSLGVGGPDLVRKIVSWHAGCTSSPILQRSLREPIQSFARWGHKWGILCHNNFETNMSPV